MRLKNNLDYALAYAKIGWHVFPCVTKDKTPLTRHGFKDATNEIEQIRKWWKKYPQANIGIRTGEESGIVCIDLDHKDGINVGEVSWTEQFGNLPDTVCQLTGGHGKHYLFKYPKNLPSPISCSTSKIGKCIDVKAQNGYIIVSNSLHKSGNRYQWVSGRNPLEGANLEILPEWLLNLLTARNTTNKTAIPRENPDFDASLILSALEYIDADDYEEWIEVGMALHSTGKAEAFAIYDEWSQTSQKYDGKTHKKWDSFRADGTKTLKSLFYLARNNGWKQPFDDKPTITVTANEREINDMAIKVLREQKNIYQRGSEIVEVINTTDNPKIGSGRSSRISSLAPARLREILSDIIHWEINGGKKESTAVHPPSWSVEGIRSRKHWPELRRLDGFSEVPIVRPNGTLVINEGYDSESHLFHSPNFEIRDLKIETDKESAFKARDLLLSIVADFPFMAEEHRSSWLAALLTPFLKFAYAGSTPFFLVTANTQGAGKTLLINLISLIYSGREIPCAAYPHSEDELRKKITSLAMGLEPLILFDNIKGKFGSESLHIALTSRIWEDRVLGKNESIQCPLNMVWFGTGNNVTPDTDMIRRTLPISLITEYEKPQNRDDFTLRDIRLWVKSNRVLLLSAAYTIICAYFAAQKPEFPQKNWGSYEGWSSLIRNIILWLEMPDPYGGVTAFAEEADFEHQDTSQFLLCLHKFYPNQRKFTAIELLQIQKSSLEPDGEEIESSIIQFAATNKSTFPNAKTLGRRMGYIKDKIVSGFRLRRAKKTNAGVFWFVEKVE